MFKIPVPYRLSMGTQLRIGASTTVEQSYVVEYDENKRWQMWEGGFIVY
jgi:hypothetical protein